MINPINPAIEIGWRGTLYLCDLPLGQLALVEGEVGIPIVYPAPVMLWQKPEAYQRGVLLYAMLQPHVPGIRLTDCMDAVVGDQRDYFLTKLQKATDRLQPQLHALWGLNSLKEAPKDKAPLAVSSGGQNSGPSPESTSDSPTPTSGS